MLVVIDWIGETASEDVAEIGEIVVAGRLGF
jgi:hypothetical protein